MQSFDEELPLLEIAATRTVTTNYDEILHTTLLALREREQQLFAKVVRVAKKFRDERTVTPAVVRATSTESTQRHYVPAEGDTLPGVRSMGPIGATGASYQIFDKAA